MGQIIIIFASVILCFIGAVFLIVSLAMGRSIARKKQECTMQTTAAVVSLDRRMGSHHSGSMSSVSWYPTYEYYAGGQKIVRESNIGSGDQKFYVGQKVTLHYNPQNYTDYYVEEENAGILRLIFMIVGIVLLVCGVATVILGNIILTNT
jgi:hypothetical protein